MDVTSISPVLIALGGNMPSSVGAPAATLRAALAELEARGAPVQAVSAFYATPCFPAGAGPDYVNAAAALDFDGAPDVLLDLLHEVEALFGRDRQERWGRRTLDLDLLAMGNSVLPDDRTHRKWRDLDPARQALEAPGELILPHPRLSERAFVLIPLLDVAPDWVHPVTGATVRKMVQALSEKARKEVVAL